MQVLLAVFRVMCSYLLCRVVTAAPVILAYKIVSSRSTLKQEIVHSSRALQIAESKTPKIIITKVQIEANSGV